MDDTTALTELWPDARPTPLRELPELARRAGVARVLVKVEGERPLGSFKSLGGMLAGLRALARAANATTIRELLAGPRRNLPALVCASDGNHGLAVTAAAQRAGATAIVYLPATVGPVRAARIEGLGGHVVRVDGTFDDAVQAAAAAARRGEGLLIADTTTDPDDVVVGDVMAGYGLLARELVAQLDAAPGGWPSHLFVQAGVGGLAATMAEGLHAHLSPPSHVAVVEPARAPCVAHALARGRADRVAGDVHSVAEMLSCDVASTMAVEVLRRYPVHCVVVDEDDLSDAPRVLRACGGPDSTPTGAAGVAALLRVAADATLRDAHRLDARNVVLLIATEGALPPVGASGPC